VIEGQGQRSTLGLGLGLGSQFEMRSIGHRSSIADNSLVTDSAGSRCVDRMISGIRDCVCLCVS